MSDAAANADLPGEAVSTAESSIPLDRMSRRRPNLTSGPLSTRLLVYAGVVVLAGVISGWVWHAIVKVPSYLTGDDGSVQMTERAVGQIFSMDAIYVIIGLLAGLALGLVAWALFPRVGWPVAAIATVGGLASGAVCWLVGVLQGPSGFAERIAEASSGDRIPIDFQLHTASALLVWALGAIIPVMLYANLSHEGDASGELPMVEKAESGAGASDLGESGTQDVGQVASSQLD